jgi:hypothetical protein
MKKRSTWVCDFSMASQLDATSYNPCNPKPDLVSREYVTRQSPKKKQFHASTTASSGAWAPSFARSLWLSLVPYNKRSRHNDQRISKMKAPVA